MDISNYDCIKEVIRSLGDLKSPLKQKLLRALFGRIERVPQSQLSFIGKYKEIDLKENCATWVDHGINILKQLYIDIHLARELLHPTEWDLDTFADAIKLIKYTLNTVMEKDGILAKAAELCLGKMRNTHFRGPSRTYQDLGNDFLIWSRNVSRACHELIMRVAPARDRPNLKILTTDMIYATTFLELVVRNYSSKISITDMTEARFLEKFEQDRGTILEGEDFKEAQEGLSRKCNWHPATLCVVLHTETGIVFTGATQPRAEGIKPLQIAAKRITRMRLGASFQNLIEQSSKTLWELVPQGRRLDNIRNFKGEGQPPDLRGVPEMVHTAIANELQDRWMHTSNVGSEIHSVAFNDLFHYSPPCVRCKELYSAWRFPTPHSHLPSIDWQDWKYHLTGHQLEYNNGCSFCAETVAAAKFHYLFEGTLTFVLPGERI